MFNGEVPGLRHDEFGEVSLIHIGAFIHREGEFQCLC